jgi:hypothetical protein
MPARCGVLGRKAGFRGCAQRVPLALLFPKPVSLGVPEAKKQVGVVAGVWLLAVSWWYTSLHTPQCSDDHHHKLARLPLPAHPPGLATHQQLSSIVWWQCRADTWSAGQERRAVLSAVLAFSTAAG